MSIDTPKPNETAQESALEHWRETAYDPAVKKYGQREPSFITSSGIPVEPLYTQASLPGWEPERALGFPGAYPYTRGIQPTMYRGKLWTMRQYAGFATAAESNKRYRYLLEHGTTGLSVAFDLPTQMG